MDNMEIEELEDFQGESGQQVENALSDQTFLLRSSNENGSGKVQEAI